MMAYDNGKVAEFTYTPLSIELYKDGKIVKIDMTRQPEYFAIYTRFETDNDLYAYSDRVAHNIPNLMQRPECMYDMYKKVNDHCYMDVVIMKDPEQDDEFTTTELDAIKNYKKEFENRIKIVQEYSGIYYSNYVTVSRGTENDKRILIFNEDERYIIVEKQKFKEEVLSKIMAAERNVINENMKESKLNLLDDSRIQKFPNQKKYRVDTGKEIEEEQDEEEEEETEEEEEEHRQEEPGTEIDENDHGPEDSQSHELPQPSQEPSQTPPSSQPTPSPSAEFSTRVYY